MVRGRYGDKKENSHKFLRYSSNFLCSSTFINFSLIFILPFFFSAEEPLLYFHSNSSRLQHISVLQHTYTLSINYPSNKITKIFYNTPIATIITSSRYCFMHLHLHNFKKQYHKLATNCKGHLKIAHPTEKIYFPVTSYTCIHKKEVYILHIIIWSCMLVF